MRRFRFVGDPSDYETNEPPFLVGQIYRGDFIGEGCMSTVQEYATRPWSSNAWQEVFDEPKPLHKDTDLGHFAGLAMQGILANEELRMKILADASQQKISSFEAIQNESIVSAKELIKQLNEERK